MHRFRWLALLTTACTSSPTQAPGTILTGTLTYSPITDPLAKFDVATRGLTDQIFPSLELLDESSIGTGNCSMLVLSSPDTSGQWGWQFAAPAGMTFAHLTVEAPVTVDPRASFTAEAVAGLRTDDAEVNLAEAGAGSAEPLGTQTSIDAAVAGTDHFEIIFDLANNGYTSDLQRIFTQALRQCPGDPVPFSISASFE
jgi:hypothetical protein